MYTQKEKSSNFVIALDENPLCLLLMDLHCCYSIKKLLYIKELGLASMLEQSSITCVGTKHISSRQKCSIKNYIIFLYVN